jgi:LacI family transcriptional regulator
MPNIHDVARSANVSISTVSRVMNGDQTVHPALRDVVQDAVRRTGYRPNAAARSLRLARTNTIGVIVSDMLNPPFTSIVHGIARAAGERGVSLFLCDAGGSVEVQAAHLGRLHERRVDGVVIHPIGRYHRQVEPLRKDGIPVVIIGQRAPSGGHTEIVVDEDDASYEAVRHLLDMGHRRIAVVTRRWSTSSDSSTGGSRVAVYRRAHADAGVPVDESLIFRSPGGEKTHAIVRELLRRPDRPTALICGIHSDAPEMLAAAKEAGLSIPGDLSIFSYGDSRWAQVHTPPLAVIRSDYDLYGRRAAGLLFALTAGEDEPVTLHHQAEFVARDSCAPPGNHPE